MRMHLDTQSPLTTPSKQPRHCDTTPVETADYNTHNKQRIFLKLSSRTI